MRHTALALALLLLVATVSCGGADDCVDCVQSYCTLSISVDPAQPDTTSLVEVVAFVDTNVDGFQALDWSVTFDGASYAFDVDSSNQDVILFDPMDVGVYTVAVSGSVGTTECEADVRDINVAPPGAVLAAYRLRIVPRPGAAVPAQDIDLELPGGVPEYSLGTVTLDGGVAAEGTLLGPGAVPLAGYLRATLPADETPLMTEAFADGDGAFAMSLLSRPYDLLAVPDSATVAPARFASLAVTAIDGAIVLDAGDQVTGTVVDGVGDPVVGARVALTVDGVPSTVAVTSGAGAFSLRARAGGPVAVTVAPDAASGLPQLELDAPVGSTIADGSTIAVVYSPSLDTRAFSPAIRLKNGTSPAPGARVTLRAHTIVGAGTVSVDGDDFTARGELVRAAVADGGGDLPAQVIPDAVYDVVVEPAGGAPASEGVRLTTLNLTGVNPSPTTLSLASPTTLAAQVHDAGGDAVSAARVLATPRGALGGTMRSGASGLTSSAGAVALALAGGGEYELSIDGAPAGAVRARSVVTASAAGTTMDLGDLTLAPAVSVEGTLTSLGDLPVAAAHVELVCLDCGPDGQAVLVAETTTTASGRFLLLVPDPAADE